MTVQPPDAEYCYLTTTGRRTGRPHRIEIWFNARGSTLYLLSGGRDRSDWVRNLLANPEVTVHISGQTFHGTARPVSAPDEDELARSLLVAKYERRPGNLARWRRTALPIAVDLHPSPSPPDW